MKKLLFLGMLLFAGLAFNSCQQEAVEAEGLISEEVQLKIQELGLSTDGMKKFEDGYIVEGDIFISEERLNETPRSTNVPNLEQYRTFNLVERLPRTIRVYIAEPRGGAPLMDFLVSATEEAMDRYNRLNLDLTFTRVSSSAQADIRIRTSILPSLPFLASASFPTSSGNPGSTITINGRALGGAPRGTVVSVMAHEIGHCIGFRHTDWFDRSISCGGPSPQNEGSGGVGAVHIPGTPTGADLAGQGSFMLSCIGRGQNRTFTTADRIALRFLYD